MKKSMKVFLIIVAVLAVLVIVGKFALQKLFTNIANAPSVPDNYIDTVKTGGDIEAKYLAMGQHEVSYYESTAFMPFEKYEIYYPADIADFNAPLPVMVFVNGTGTGGSKYPALQKHLASWGFITIATEEKNDWYGFAAEMGVRYLEMINAQEDKLPGDVDNVFYGKVDVDNIGITGHSQGGFGVVNAITQHRNKDRYKAAVILSSNAQTNPGLQWEADATLIKAPTMIIGSTGSLDAALASYESLQTLYGQIPDDVDKLLARRNDADHGEMLYFADGYVTAWFMWRLQGDTEAAKAFTGDAPELLTNPLYQDQKINLD